MRKSSQRGLTALCALAFWSVGAAAQEGSGDAIEQGREIFLNAQPACQICHTLEDAGSTGEIGPNLDYLQPSKEQVRTVVQGGADGMPAYGDILSEEEIDAVATYIATVTGE